MKEGDIPKITDYGLAKLLDSVPCSTSGDGTMNYRAPELLNPAHRRSKASDIYALAGVCYAVSDLPLLMI
jgi:serine/threonine protein kinase